MRNRRSDDASPERLQRISDNVLRLPILSDIPDPNLPLNGVGLTKYFETCERLLRRGTLTRGNRDIAEQLAILHHEQHRKVLRNRPVPTALMHNIMRATIALKLDEDATPLGNPNKRSETTRFSFVGFAARASSALTIRRSA